MLYYAEIIVGVVVCVEVGLSWPFSLSSLLFWQSGRKSASILTRTD